MALTLPRWVIAAALCATALWFSILHVSANRIHSGISAAPIENVRSASSIAGAAMTQAVDRLRLLQIRDSILRTLGRRDSNAVTVLVSSAYGPVARPLDSLIRARWMAAGVSGNHTVIAAVVDSATAIGQAVRPRLFNLTSVSTLLPDSTGNPRCMAILRVPVALDATWAGTLRRDLIAPETISALIGPCLYYATFGHPGAAIAQWLANGSWRIAHITDWEAPPPTLSQSAAAVWSRRSWNTGTLPAFLYDARVWTTTTGLACLAGEAGRCVDAIQPSRPSDADSVWRAHVVPGSAANEIAFRYRRGRTRLGPLEGWLLSDMVRALGKERFGAFWRSGQSVPQAFRAASNESLDTWVHEWAVRTYGPVPAGPGLDSGAALAGVGLLVGALLVAALISRSRRVG